MKHLFTCATVDEIKTTNSFFGFNLPHKEQDTCPDCMILSQSTQGNHFLRVQGALLQNEILSACHCRMSRSKIASYSTQKPWKN